jgi:hypothetical protein
VHQEAGVRGREAVHVLRRIDQPDELVLVEVLGQRELEQDAVHAVVRVQRADQLRELLGHDVSARLVVERLDPDLGRVLPLHAHVHGGRRVVADEDRREPRRPIHRRDLAPHLLAHLRRDSLPVDDLGHGRERLAPRASCPRTVGNGGGPAADHRRFKGA